MVADASTLNTLLDQLGKIHIDELPCASSHLAGPENLVHGLHQAVGIFQHQTIEPTSLSFAELPPFEGLQMKTDGSNRCLQFVSDSIDEAVVLFVASDFANQEAGIQDEASDNGAEEKDPQQDFNVLLPIKDDPAKSDTYRRRSKQNANGQKEDDFAAPANAHGKILARSASRQLRDGVRPA